MSDISDAMAAITTACGTVEGVRVYRTEDLAMMLPPGVVISPPVIKWETFDPAPTSLDVTVWVVGLMNDYAVEQLIDLTVAVQAAIESGTGGSVAVATPTTLELSSRGKGAAEYPAYQLVVNYPL